MKKHNNLSMMVPILNSEAGNCLTAANWQEAGIQIGSYYLSSLLMKPGYDCLKHLANLASYVNWRQHLVLNASLPNLDDHGCYALRSQYDGSRIHYSVDEILALIAILQANTVILPQGVGQKWQLLPEAVFPYLTVSDYLESEDIKRPKGIYLLQDENNDILQQLDHYKGLPCYVAGDWSLAEMKTLFEHGAQYVETNRPARDAMAGQLYCSEGVISIYDDKYAYQFDIIDKNCACPSCSQQFTRAYLHHLLEHTPLLCQRFLIQHNVYFCQYDLSSFTSD